MGIETGEPRPPAAGDSAKCHCAESEQPPASYIVDRKQWSREREQVTTDGTTQNVKQPSPEEGSSLTTEEEEEMSIFCERQPKDVLHFETVYVTEADDGEELTQALASEHLYEETTDSKTLALQRQQEEAARAIQHFHKKNIHQQWLYGHEYPGNGFSVKDVSQNEIFKTIIDSNGIISLSEDVSGLLGISSPDEKKAVFVRRGESQAWRAWQEILGQSIPEKKLYAIYDTDRPVVMCFSSAITVHVSIEGHSLADDTRVYVDFREENGDLLISGVYITKGGSFSLEFTPKIRGEAVASMKCVGPKSTGVAPYKMQIEVLGNNPILSFNDGCGWPVSLAFDHKEKFIYVAYTNYITKYQEDDEFVEYIKRLTYLELGHYNDLALTSNGQMLVASYSGFHSEPVKYRYQAINIYSTDDGRLLNSVDNSFPLFIFDSPILHLATKSDDSVLVADRFSVCEISVWDGEINTRLKILDMGSVSRIAFRNDRYYVADGNIGFVKIYDELGIMETCFQMTTADGDAVRGLSGLAVDHLGNILVSDCLSGSVHVYKEDGTLICSIDSDWEMLHWPLNLVATDDGHMLVVDHRNACVKKYKYLEL